MTAQIDIRESYKQFPNWLQPFLTWFTGKAYANQKPLVVISKWMHLFITLACYLGGIVLSLYLVNVKPSGWYVYIVVSWMLILTGARKCAETIVHHCGHQFFSGYVKVDKLIGEAVSTMICMQDVVPYRYDHGGLHHSKRTFGTYQDQNVVFLLKNGFKPGMSKKSLWLQFFKCLYSPAFHVRTNVMRLMNNITAGSWSKFLFNVIYFATAMTVIKYFNLGFFEVFIGYLFPMFYLYNISLLLEVLSEHAWLIQNQGQEERVFYAKRCWGRFCGAPLPDKNLPFIKSIWAWMKWGVSMVFYHFIVRVTVLTGDLPQHDYHHRISADKNWHMATYMRQRDIDNGHKGWPPYEDVWGLFNAIDKMFEGLAQLEALEPRQMILQHI